MKSILNDIITYPEPFNPYPGSFKRGDIVITKDGLVGTVQDAQDFDGYDYNKPSDKWELVHWQDDGSRNWTSKYWIKKLDD